MSLCHVQYSTIHRWRKKGDFPEPVTGGGKKLLWSETQIIQWMNQHNTTTVLTAPCLKQQKANQKAFEQRQVAAKAAIQRHTKPRRGN